MFKNYLKIALRNLRKYKGNSLINIAGLAVGLACFLLIALWIQDELSFDEFHQQKNRLYRLTITHHNGILDPNVPYALAPLMADEYKEITAFTRIYEYGEQVQSYFKFRPDQGTQVAYNENNIILVDKDFFSMFSFQFKKGNPDTALKTQNSVVITEEMAGKYFGKEDPLGKVLNLNNRRNLTVTGVISIPNNSHLQTDFIIPLRTRLDDNWNWRDPSYLLLAPGVNSEQFGEKIAGFMNEKMPYKSRNPFILGLLPITQVHLGFGRGTYVTIFTLIGILILVIACINYANLATARSGNRIREVGLRLVNGARKKQMVQQFLSESVLTTVVAFLFSLILVILLLPVLNNLTEKEISLSLLPNNSLFFILIPLILLVGFLSGIYPAFFLTRLAPAESLKGTRGILSKVSRFRVFSVIAQFAISILLIISTIIIYQQIDFIQNRPLGFSTSNVLKLPINPVILGRFTHYKNLLRENPGILSVTAGQSVPYNEDYKTGGLNWDGKDPQRTTNVRYSIAHFNYLETFGMEMKSGESYKENNLADLNRYIINEKAAEYMGMENPVGKSLTFWGQKGIIKGVVKNYHHVPLHREIMPQIFTINPKYWQNLKYIFIKIASKNIPETLEFIRAKTTALAPGHPFSYSFLDREMEQIYRSEQKIGKMIGYFAFLAIFISCLGLFGLASFSAESRTKEIGIRKVLGASIPSILVLLNKQFVRWVLLANIVAWPLAYYAMSSWLKGFAYKVTIDFWAFILAPLIALAIALITVIYQAVRVSLARPVEALRYE